MPQIQSIASLQVFTMEKTGPIIGDVILASSDSLSSVAFDGANFPVAAATGADCFIGTTFESSEYDSFVGILEEVKFFIDYFSDKSVYAENLLL